MKAIELSKMSVTELNEELLKLRREQFNLRMQQGTGQLSRPDQMSKVRRDIARIKTVINQLGRQAGAS